MDKNNSNSSSSSVCTKIRQALTSNPAVRAVQRITSFNQEPTNKPLTKGTNSQSSITNISIQNKPHPHYKAHTEGSGSRVISIKFDNGSVAKGAERAMTKVAVKGEPHHPHHVPMQGKQMDVNDRFNDFIQNIYTREKMMRRVTIGRAQSNHAAAPDHGEAHGSNKNESHFSEFIQRARKKLRTTTTVRKNNYYKKE